MSYSFDMSFVSCDELEAHRLMRRFTKEMGKKENVKKMLQDETFYIPTLKYSLHDHDMIPIGRMLDEYWLTILLTVRFVYWPKHQLLALVGNAWPNAEKYFPKHVCFQNSCDQNYDFKNWSDTCSFFDGVMIEIQDMSDEEIIKETGYEPDDEDDDFAKVRDYYVRTAVYKRIFKELALGDWLYGAENEAFERYSICAVQTAEQRMELSRTVLQPLVRSLCGSNYDLCRAHFPVLNGKLVDMYSIQYQFRNHNAGEKNEQPTDADFVKQVEMLCKNFSSSDRGQYLQGKFDFSIADILRQTTDRELADHGLRREKSMAIVDIEDIARTKENS